MLRKEERLMRKTFWTFLVTITLTICLLNLINIFSFQNALAASTSTITEKKVDVVPLSDTDCNLLLQADSSRTKKDCVVTITSQTTKPANFMATGCPSGDVSHSVDNNGLLTWHTTLAVTFHFPGNCTRPSVTYINCTNNMWAVIPVTIENKECTHWDADANRVVAQGTWNLIGYISLGNFTTTTQSIADKGGTITDAKN